MKPTGNPFLSCDMLTLNAMVRPELLIPGDDWFFLPPEVLGTALLVVRSQEVLEDLVAEANGQVDTGAARA